MTISIYRKVRSSSVVFFEQTAALLAILKNNTRINKRKNIQQDRGKIQFWYCIGCIEHKSLVSEVGVQYELRPSLWRTSSPASLRFENEIVKKYIESHHFIIHITWAQLTPPMTFAFWYSPTRLSKKLVLPCINDQYQSCGTVCSGTMTDLQTYHIHPWERVRGAVELGMTQSKQKPVNVVMRESIWESDGGAQTTPVRAMLDILTHQIRIHAYKYNSGIQCWDCKERSGGKLLTDEANG